ncbi:MAG: hypothetical protein EHM20_12260, partial [Alphaproteobacteria bacterium]
MTDRKLFTIIPYKDQLVKLENPSSAIAYYRHYSINLLTGVKVAFEFEEWISANQNNLLSSIVDSPRVIHLFYELGFLIEKDFDLLDENSLLAIDIEFSTFQIVVLEEVLDIQLELISYPTMDEY